MSAITLTVASEKDRQTIYKIRHAIYANELHQHSTNATNELSDDLDVSNHYVVAKIDNEVGGFISITSPASTKFSVDKYFQRSSIPYQFDHFLFEIRLLTVVQKNRNSPIAFSLMYAAFRWVQSHGGRNIVAICRTDLIDMYMKAGLTPTGSKASSGEVTYELSLASIDELQRKVLNNRGVYTALQKRVNWRLPFLFFAPPSCYHGGSFFKEVGENLQTLEKAKQVINADVLDAWFPPSPKVLSALQTHLPWLIQTSPPTYAEGLIEVIAERRGVYAHNILPGAGSSDLIFLSLRTFLTHKSNVLIIDPCYGEYMHVLEHIIRCTVTRFTLSREEGFKVDTISLLEEISKGYDMVVLVNPNSPTGVHIPKDQMIKMLVHIPPSTIFWIDETYVEYAGPNQSLEQFAMGTEHVIICKSMSKVYSLSGVRAAYLCCSPHFIETLKGFTPPWAVSLPAQLAAIAALKDSAYYEEKYSETHRLRKQLKEDLVDLGMVYLIEGIANFILFYLPSNSLQPDIFLQKCQEENCS